MDIYTTIFVIIGLIIIGLLVFLIVRSSKPSSLSSSSELARLENELKNVISEKERYFSAGNELRRQNISLEEKHKTSQVKIHELEKKIAQFEEQKDRFSKEHENSLTKLEQSRKTLEDEKMRIRNLDEEQKREQEENRDRMWAEHENKAIAHMKLVCQKPDFDFMFYENTSLPETFDGKFKPDFLIEFLGQYIIFDPKKSTSKNLKNYIREQIQSTVKKIQSSQNKDEIYPMVFLIIPASEMHLLDTTSFYEDGYSVYIIPLESFESILASFRKIREYDLAESFDPKERENIVNVIAGFSQFVNIQNSYHILSTLQGLKTLDNQQNLSPEMQKNIENIKQKIRLETYKPTAMKKLMNRDSLIQEVEKLISPQKPQISEQDLEDASQTLL